MNTQWGNASGIRALQVKYKHKIAGPEAIAIRVPAMSYPQNLSRWIKVSTLLNLPQILRVFKIQLGSVVTYWVQRNLSPTASLLLHANCLWAT